MARGAKVPDEEEPEQSESSSSSGDEDEDEAQDLEDGFYNQHHCTDVICAAVFLVAVAAFGFVFVWAQINGNPEKLSHGIDRYGRICGVDANVTKKPFVYFCPESFTFVNSSWELKVDQQDPICLSSCPNPDVDMVHSMWPQPGGGGGAAAFVGRLLADDPPGAAAALDPVAIFTPSPLPDIPTVPPPATLAPPATVVPPPPIVLPPAPDLPGAATVDTALAEEELGCRSGDQRAYATTPIAAWYCLPNTSALAINAVHLERSIGSITEGGGDFFGVGNSWPVLAAVVLLATILGYAYLFFLRILAKGLIWISVVVSILALVGASWYFWTQGHMALTKDQGLDPAELQRLDLASKALSALMALLGMSVTCLACCCATEVELSTKCLQQGTLVIWKMPLLLCAPLFKAAAKALLAVCFFMGLVRLYSAGHVTGLGMNRKVEFDTPQTIYLVIFIVVGLWILEFVTALYQFSIAYAVAKYYNATTDEGGNRDVDCLGLLEGVRAGLVFHTGSLAFGSGIITTLEVLQRLLQYAEAKNREESNAVVVCVLDAMLCCCACLRGLVEFVSRNAYIDMAISSTNFCAAVRNVGHVILDHGAAMTVLNSATFIFQAAGMIMTTAVCSVVAWLLLSSETFSHPYSPYHVSNLYLAILLAALLALMVSWAFMTVFDMATDTLLFCMSMDMTKNGTATHADAEMRSLFMEARSKAERLKRAAEKEAKKAQAQRAADAAKAAKAAKAAARSR